MENTTEKLFQRLQMGVNADCSIASQIAEQIRWLIVTNEICIGEMLPSVRSLADHLKVNFHTVRAAYSMLEDSKLISTKQGLGSFVIEYKPSETVSSNTLPTHTFGIIVPDLQNPFYPAFLTGAGKIAIQHNVLMITCDTKEQIPLGKAYFDMLITKRVDGMLISPMGSYPSASDFFDDSEYYDFPIPIVFVDRPNVEGYSVLLDAKDAGFKATKHLIDHGHKHIAILTGNLTIPTLRQCYEGYLSALEKSRIEFNPLDVIEVAEFSYQQGYLAAVKLMENKRIPSAIFAAGDILAIGAMKALRENNIRVPEDIALTGYNDIDVSNFVSPSLTSVSIPVQQMGEESVKLLLKLVNKQKVEKVPLLMPTELVIRESCGCNRFNQRTKK